MSKSDRRLVDWYDFDDAESAVKKARELSGSGNRRWRYAMCGGGVLYTKGGPDDGREVRPVMTPPTAVVDGGRGG